MMRSEAKFSRRRIASVASAALLAIGLAACGSSATGGGQNSSATAGGQSTSATGGGQSTSATAGGQSTSANTAKAAAIVAPYLDKPTPFPAGTPLAKPVPAGQTVGFLQCATPVCGIFAQLYAGAAKVMGVHLVTAKAGASTAQLQQALSSILSQHPKGVLIPGIDADSIRPQIAQAKASHIPLSVDGQTGNTAAMGIGSNQLGPTADALVGKLLAAWVIKDKGAKANVAMYTTPELNFAAPIVASFKSELASLCSSCSVRVIVIPIATIGTTAPGRIVNDLQAHPQTNVAVFASQEEETGLPTALKTAGVHVDQVGFAPTPVLLQEIKSGQVKAGLALDLATLSWTELDALARLMEGQPITPGEQSGIPVMQFVTRSNLPANVSQGWVGYPDFAKRFAKLWHP